MHHFNGHGPGGGNGNPLQYSCLKNSRQAIQSVGSQSPTWLSDWARMHILSANICCIISVGMAPINNDWWAFPACLPAENTKSFILIMPPEVSVRQYCIRDAPAHFRHKKTDDEEKQSAQLFYRSTVQYLKGKNGILRRWRQILPANIGSPLIWSHRWVGTGQTELMRNFLSSGLFPPPWLLAIFADARGQDVVRKLYSDPIF